MVRDQLERMLTSGIFMRSERLSAFLRFVVEQTLQGHGNGLKEQVLGAELYGKGPEFDGVADPIVRVDARRLRDKLREYYVEFPQDPIQISLPKGSYVPAFEENGHILSRVSSSPPVPLVPKSQWLWRLLSVAGLIGSSTLILFLYRSPMRSIVPSVAVRIPSFGGEKGAPAVSPDGNFVAFASSGTDGVGKTDIWVQGVKGDGLRRLTETPQFNEISPAWSPNGKEIAFVREGEGVFIVPQTGTPERQVSPSGTQVGWAPNGESLVIRDREGNGPHALFQVLLHNFERRTLTHPNVGVGDWTFSVSPDSSKLAFIRQEHPGVADLFVVPMQGGEPRRLTNWNSGLLQGVAWAPNGKELVYSNGHLWRISANVRQPGRGVLVPGISEPADNPSMSRPKRGGAVRLAFQSTTPFDSFERIDLAAPLYNGMLQGVTPFITSVNFSYPGAYSADGTRFMFATGPPPLKLCFASADGSLRQEVVSLNATQLNTGNWSADGRRLIYEAAIDGNDDVFAVDIDGSNPKRLTQEASLDGLPSWSRDGRWIYYSSTRAGVVPDIWRMPAQGGEPVRITYHGGLNSQESPDRKHLYYAALSHLDEVGKAKLMQVPVEGGPEKMLLDNLSAFWWTVARTGIYFIVRELDFDEIHHYRFRDHRVVKIGRLPHRIFLARMFVSPDERWVLVPHRNVPSDLMFIDNFK
jgi:Tol biopolymer transport system component